MAAVILLERDAVHELLGRVAALAGRTADTAPIIGHALIEPDTHGVRVTTTDMDAWLTLTVPAQSKKFAPIALPAEELHQVVAKLPAGAQVELAWAKEDAVFVDIKSGRSRFKLPVMAAADFPETPRGGVAAQFTASAAILNAMLARSRWASSNEEVRYYLNGVYLHISGDRLVCAATNGHTLAWADGPAPEGAEEMKGVILPNGAVKTLAKLIGDTDADIDIAVSEGHVRIELWNDGFGWSYTTRLIDGTFPDYTKVIPDRAGQIEADVEAAALQGAIARVALLTTDKAHSVKITGAKGLLTVSSAGADGRAAEEEIDAAWRAGPIGEPVGFNARYLKTVLDGIGAETVVLAFHPTSDGPTIVTARGRDDTLALIMPVRMA